jgi:pyrimidine deaminase RibD-like protein
MHYLNLAAKYALKGEVERSYYLACVVKRSDGAITASYNERNKVPIHSGHAEARAIRKADKGATIYVARITRSGNWANARPCKKCQALIRNACISKVYYTISPNEYKVWNPSKEKEPE